MNSDHIMDTMEKTNTHLCINTMTDMTYKCGECSVEVTTLCRLFQHLSAHGTCTYKYLFDDLVKVGYLRHEMVDSAVQTHWNDRNSHPASLLSDIEPVDNIQPLTHSKGVLKTHKRRTNFIKELQARNTVEANVENRKLSKRSIRNEYHVKMTVSRDEEGIMCNQQKNHKIWTPEKVHSSDVLDKDGMKSKDSFNSPQPCDVDLVHTIHKHNSNCTNTCTSNELIIKECQMEITMSVSKQSSQKTVDKSALCHVCGKVCSSKKLLYSHLTEQHQDPELMQNCQQCGKKFPTKSKLKEHLLVHSSEKNFSCTVCRKSFQRKSTLNAHVRFMHSVNTGQQFKCQQCSKTFKFPASYKQHILAHEPSFKCDVCNTVFSRQSSLKRHAMRHSGVKVHGCSICGHEFIQKSAYWIHMEKHHDLTKAKLEAKHS